MIFRCVVWRYSLHCRVFAICVIATKAMVSLGDRCLFGLFVSVALYEGCSEQSERMEIFLLVRRDARVCEISVRCVEV